MIGTYTFLFYSHNIKRGETLTEKINELSSNLFLQLHELGAEVKHTSVSYGGPSFVFNLLYEDNGNGSQIELFLKEYTKVNKFV